MYYTVYKIVNQVNGKIYIGVHKTQNLDDGYMGSGKHLIRAQDKYGIESFKKEYLSIFDNSEEMFNMESQLVNSDFVKREDTYNIKEGGFGGFDHIGREHWNKRSLNLDWQESRRVYLRKGVEILREKRKDPQFKREESLKISQGLKVYYLSHGGSFKGKNHTQDTKKKMSESKIGKCSGIDNTQYGTMWIFNESLLQNKKIKRDQFKEYSSNGWSRGRKYFK